MRPSFQLPFMHSELLADQDRCLRLHEAFGDPEQLKFAVTHRDIIAKFGRFPRIATAYWAATRRRPNRQFLDGGGFAG